MQQELTKKREEIDKKIFPGKYSFVEVAVNGKKEILKITIDRAIDLNKENIEMIEDVLIVAINDAFKKVDEEIKSKIGSLGSGISDLF